MSLVVETLVLEREDGVTLLGPLGLSLGPGDRLGLVGESGSGKSLLAQALFGTLPPGVRQTSGRITAFHCRLDQPDERRDAIRGVKLAWLPQDPLGALNPLLSMAEQLTLLPGLHRRETPSAALTRLAPLLRRLGLPDGPDFLSRRPHQLSGGQRQRLCLALALSCDPELLVLDEPTTALDPLAQKAFVELILELQQERRLGFLWIIHDLALAALACDRILVLYGGQVMEAGPSARLLVAPRHPYTARLLAAARNLSAQEAGFLPAPKDRPGGCPFESRCPEAGAGCRRPVPWQGSADDGLRCLHPLEAGPQA